VNEACKLCYGYQVRFTSVQETYSHSSAIAGLLHLARFTKRSPVHVATYVLLVVGLHHLGILSLTRFTCGSLAFSVAVLVLFLGCRSKERSCARWSAQTCCKNTTLSSNTYRTTTTASYSPIRLCERKFRTQTMT
jgi:hypothetical protein